MRSPAAIPHKKISPHFLVEVGGSSPSMRRGHERFEAVLRFRRRGPILRSAESNSFFSILTRTISERRPRKCSMKEAVVGILATFGISVSRCVDIQFVRRLVERLHPITTDKELIRIGGEGDGGYLVPDDLGGIVACFSPGVGAVASFEATLVARGIPCYLADACVAGPPILDTLIHFDKKFLGVVNDDRSMTLDAWVKNCAPPAGDLDSPDGYRRGGMARSPECQ